MNPTDPSKHEQPAMLRRVRKAIVSEFTPPPIPRPTPNEEQLTEGHLAVGMIDDAIEDGPSEVQGADTLVITAEAPGHGTLHRTTSCPLEMPRSGHRLVGQTITFRHTTFDPDYVKDILVVRWPLEVRNALRPVRDEGPGGVHARVWGFLAGCSFVLMWSGIVLTPLMLCGIVFGGDMFTDLPAWFHPGLALVASISAIPLGLFLVAVCNAREATLVHPVPKDVQ